MTILALDPDLFWAATEDGRCRYLLEDIAQKIENEAYRLALDAATVEAEFVDLFNHFSRQPEGNGELITQIYGPIAKGIRSENKVADLSSEPIEEIDQILKQTLEQFLTDNHLQEPVEPELTRMAYRASRHQTVEDVGIVLVGDDILCSKVSLRYRWHCSHNSLAVCD